MNKAMQYLKDVRAEMAKVSWPNKKEVQGATILVIALSVVMSVYVFTCDQLLQRVIALLLGAR
jgi:preprotein translocase subunit SecE